MFQEHGVEDLLGLDSEEVDPSLLEIAPGQFRAADLRDGLRLERSFDLALCLEVAHYLPAESAEGLVASLTALAPAVLFSSAIPGQGGEGVNPQWPTYWAERFGAHAYVCVDCVRPRIWDEPGVEVWYAQNVLLFAEQSLLERRPELAEEFERGRGRPLSVVHPRLHAHRESLGRGDQPGA